MEIDRELLCQLEKQGRLSVFPDGKVMLRDVYITPYIQQNILMLMEVLKIIIYVRDCYLFTENDVYKGIKIFQIGVDTKNSSLSFLLDFFNTIIGEYPQEYSSILLFMKSGIEAKLDIANSVSNEELVMNTDILYACNIRVFSSYLSIIKYTQDLSKYISEKSISVVAEDSYISYLIDDAPSLVPGSIETRNSKLRVHCNNTPFTLEVFLKCFTSSMPQGSLIGRYQGGCELQDPMDCSIQEKNIVFLHILNTVTEKQKEALNHLLHKKYNGHHLMGINYIPDIGLKDLSAHVEHEIRGVSSLSMSYSLIEMSNNGNLQASVTYTPKHSDDWWSLSVPIPVILSESTGKRLVPELIKVLETNINLRPESYLVSTPVCNERDRSTSSLLSNVSVWYR